MVYHYSLFTNDPVDAPALCAEYGCTLVLHTETFVIFSSESPASDVVPVLDREIGRGTYCLSVVFGGDIVGFGEGFKITE